MKREYKKYERVILKTILDPELLMDCSKYEELKPLLPFECVLQCRSRDMISWGVWLLEPNHPSINKYAWIRVTEADFCYPDEFHKQAKAKKELPRFRLIRK